MSERSEKVKDGGLVKEGLQQRVRNISINTGKEIDEVVSEAYRKGIAYYTVNREDIPRIEPEKLVEDSLSYSRWQMNIYQDLSEQYPGIEWSEVKSAFLEKGLEQMDG